MSMKSIRATIAVIIVIAAICATGLASGIPITVRPPDTIVVAPPPPETPITQDAFDQTYPEISNGTIVWMGNNTGQWEIYRVSAGR